MKKIVWIVIGCAVVIGVVLLANRQEAQQAEEQTTTEYTENTADPLELESLKSVQSTEEPSPQVSAAVLTLIDPATDYQTRLASMRELGYEIPEHEIEVLMRQKEMPEGLGDLLIEVVNNPGQDGMWRNYCIQFMPEFYEKARGTGQGAGDAGGATAPSSVDSGDAVPPNDGLAVVRDALWSALEERDNSNAGTALLGLDKLSRNHPEFDREEIDAAMLDLASDRNASVANRITAIRLCGEQGNAQALETTRDLARNGDTTMLRCAAIATLGDLGTEEDLSLLETYAASNDERIRRIARSSLEKLTSDFFTGVFRESFGFGLDVDCSDRKRVVALPLRCRRVAPASHFVSGRWCSVCCRLV